MCLGIPGEVISTVDGPLRMGRVDFGGSQGGLPGATSPRPLGRLRAGPRRLRHRRVDAEEARRVFACLRGARRDRTRLREEEPR